MANLIQHKRSSTSGVIPAASGLSYGELAINYADAKLYTKRSNNSVVNLAVASISGTVITPASGYFETIQFNTNIEPDLLRGQIGWNDTEGTVNIALTDDTDIHIGEHSFFRVRNSTSSTLYKGQPVYASGVHANGIINPNLYVADGSIREVRFMGLMLEDLNQNNNGYAIQFGHLDIDTRGNVASPIAVGDETWAAGDILYIHPTVAGKLTNVEPKHSISAAIVLSAASNGLMFVRPTSYGHLDDNHDVSVSVVSDKQYLRYDSNSDLWVPTSSGYFTSLDVRGPSVFNEDGGNNDFRIEGDTNANLFFVDASTDRIGIGTATPAASFEVATGGSINVANNDVTAYRVGGTAVLGKATSASGFSATVNGATRISGSKIVFTAANDNTVSLTMDSNHNVGIGTESPSYKLQVNGSFGATTKSFRIDHPSRPNYTLEYGSLESPYHGVRLTGRGKVIKGVCVVDLPTYLKDLIHDDENINIQLTNLKHGKTLYVSDISLNNSQFIVKCDRAKTLPDLEFFWTFTGVRKDVPSLVVEQEK